MKKTNIDTSYVCLFMAGILVLIIVGVFMNDHGGSFFKPRGRIELNFKLCVADLNVTKANDDFIFNDRKLEAYVWLQEQEGVDYKLVPESSRKTETSTKFPATKQCVTGKCIRSKKNPKAALKWSIWDADYTPDDQICEEQFMNCELIGHTEKKYSGACYNEHCEQWNIETSWKVWK